MCQAQRRPVVWMRTDDCRKLKQTCLRCAQQHADEYTSKGWFIVKVRS